MNNSILTPQIEEVRIQRSMFEEKLNLFGIDISIYRNSVTTKNSFGETEQTNLQLIDYEKVIKDDETDIRYLKKIGWLIDQHPNTEFLLFQCLWNTIIQKDDVIKVSFNMNNDGYNGGQDYNYLQVAKFKGISLYNDVVYVLLQLVPYHGKV